MATIPVYKWKDIYDTLLGINPFKAFLQQE